MMFCLHYIWSMSRFSLLFSYLGHFLIWKLLSNSRMVMDQSCLHYKCTIQLSWYLIELWGFQVVLLNHHQNILTKRAVLIKNCTQFREARSTLTSWLQEDNSTIINSLHKMCGKQFCQLTNPDCTPQYEKIVHPRIFL